MAQEKRRILVVGASNMELYMGVDRLPEQGETVMDGGGVAYIPGGLGICYATALARLSEHSVLCTKLGADIHGQKLYNFAKDNGVDSSFIRVDHDNGTGLSVIIREADGENRCILYPGANSYISQEAVLEAFGCSPDGVVLGLDIPFGTVLSAARIASAKGIPVFLDASPVNKDCDLEALPELTAVILSEAQMTEYTGIAPVGMENSLRACLSLCKRIKCKSVVIKLGARGAFVYDGKRYYSIPAHRAEKVVDEAGAGCAFGAAMVSEYLYSGGDLKSAVTYGCAAGAIAVSRPGGASSAPKYSELCEFLAKL